MRRKLAAVLATAVVTALLLLVAASPAAAHTVKKVGAYQFVVGWGSEPAYAGLLNSVQLVLTKLSDGKPVVNLGNSLTVTVVYGTQKMPLALTPTFDPDTGVGTQVVDESFTSGPTTFATVEDPMNAQFPVKAPSAVQLSQRLDTALPRLKSSSSSSSGRTYGIIGIAIGALGLIAGGFALVRARA
jgi:hypothetical protein